MLTAAKRDGRAPCRNGGRSLLVCESRSALKSTRSGSVSLAVGSELARSLSSRLRQLLESGLLGPARPRASFRTPQNRYSLVT